jgi:biopolymer transport protein ExbD
MAQKRRFLDVWLVESNTVYREVPFTVVADWVAQSRLLPDDMLRPSGTAQWFKVGSSPEFTPYIPRSEPYRVDDRAEAEEPVELEFSWKRKPEDEEDDVDMIPLIDISLVLLIFFIMTTTTAAAVFTNQTPEAGHGWVTSSTDMLWIGIKKDKDGTPFFAIGKGLGRPESQDAFIPTKHDLLQRLDELLAKEEGKVDVNILADKTIDAGLVRDLTVELGKRDKVGKKFIGVSEKTKP